MNINEKILILEAYRDDKSIEVYDGCEWRLVSDPGFNFMDYKYRVAKEYWFNKYSDRLSGPYSSEDDAHCGAANSCYGQVRLYEHPR